LRPPDTAEHQRLRRARRGEEDWRLFGPYLAERQWGTIREDYSETGACWDYFPHDHARSRTYRWGEDGLLGFTDREARLCFGLAIWNGRDPILKERLFGLSAPEGNHGEDVKELYYYLDATPTHSYLKALYKYPLWAYPYERLVRGGRERGLLEPELEIEDTGVFDRGRYVDVLAEYAKASPTDVVMKLTFTNRSGDEALLHVIPQLWFRNTWSWGREGEPGYPEKPSLKLAAHRCVAALHPELGRFLWEAGCSSTGIDPTMMFTENETNMERIFASPNSQPYVKDAFHAAVVGGRPEAINPSGAGTKAGAHYRLTLPARQSVVIHLRLASEADLQSRLGLRRVEETIAERAAEADHFYRSIAPHQASPDEANVLRQGYASLLWSKQFYSFKVADWLSGDPAQPPPPPQRREGRNRAWTHLVNHDVLSVPDAWEYPWYAAWDLAFHMIPFARVDPEFARTQLQLFLNDRYMHPSGQLPAYEFGFGDVNPPVHAWACLRVFEITRGEDPESRAFLRAVFEPLARNFRWWQGLAAGGGRVSAGFLGLDNISAFDRGARPPGGGSLEQADGAAWLAFFAVNMVAICCALAEDDPREYDERACQFLDQFIASSHALNRTDGLGHWHEGDGFYYDYLTVEGTRLPVRVRSMVGLIPLFASLIVEEKEAALLPRLRSRLQEIGNRREGETGPALLSIVGSDALLRLLGDLFHEDSFLAPHGVRSLSRLHLRNPAAVTVAGQQYRVEYAPEESRTHSFGANSNWRGPVWFPLNFLLVEALERYGCFYGDRLTVSYPSGSDSAMPLGKAAQDLERRLSSIFLTGPEGRRPCHGEQSLYVADPHFRDLILFHEYFSGETGRGLGASHQSGWTALALRCIENVANRRSDPAP